MENKLSVGGTLSKSINFAMQQNYVPLIRNLILINNSDEAFDDIELKISFTPEFAKEYSYRIAELSAKESVEISPVKIQMNTDYLFRLTEKIVGNINITVVKDGDTLYGFDNEIELLAYDQWSGLLLMPEIISAFSTPNHPAVSEVISEASKYLSKWLGDPSFSGYQTNNSNKVKLQMAAIYNALQNRAIVYNNPPASYEEMGQRVRLPHNVLGQKQGTCLDLAVLYTACLESIGLYPLIIFVKGHAFVGCWLEEQTFADCFVDDVSAVEKRIADGAEEILLVECTDFVAGSSIDFDRAVKHGNDHINSPENFICAVDIKRTRGSGIRPIPLQLDFMSTAGTDTEKKTEVDFHHSQAPAALDNSLVGKVAGGGETIVTKQKLWERKLLNLSLRNTLLNFRATKGSFRIMTADLGALEDKLADGKDLSVLEIPSEWAFSARDPRLFEIDNDKDLVRTIAEEEFKSNRIRTFLKEDEFKKTLESLRRAAISSLEENGANTLFLALGFLRWFDSKLSEKSRYAPVVMIPIDLVRSTKTRGYVIRSRQEETRINVTLLEYLRQDHGINITGLDPLPEDDHGVDIPLIMNTVRQAVKNKERWNVVDMAFVGLFSFGQFVMWSDITNRADELKKNKVVSSLIKGEMTWQPVDEEKIQSLENPVSLTEMAVPLDADSSQLRAINAAAAGQSFVLHGPPGTGKSQTITNMIANALYQGKTVLFVAEKMAALNVVQKRLYDIGLDPFCLELHSNKTNKSNVLSELDKALNVGRIKSPAEYENTAENVRGFRLKLNGIMEALHSQREFGNSLYEAIEYYEDNSGYKGMITFAKDKLGNPDKNKISEWNDLVRNYSVITKEIGVLSEHPFLKYNGTEYSIELREKFRSEVDSLISQYKSASESIGILSGCFGFDIPGTRDNICSMIELSKLSFENGIILKDLVNTPNYDSVAAVIHKLIEVGSEYEILYSEITETFERNVLEYDSANGKMAWNCASDSWFITRFIKQRKLLKELRMYSKSSGTVTKENITVYYDKLNSLKEKKDFILNAPTEATRFLSGLFMGLSTDWNAVKDALRKTELFRVLLQANPLTDASAIIDCLSNVAKVNYLYENINCAENFVNRLAELSERFGIDFDEEQKNENWLQASFGILHRFSVNISEMRYKVEFNRIDKQLVISGLEAVSKAYREGSVNGDTVISAYICNLYYDLILMTISDDERLSKFRGKLFDDIIVQYKQAISEYKRLTVQELVARLSSKTPSSGIVSSSSSELGILKKAIKSNGRMMSIRKLFQQIPVLLRRLCPCMLMSPISVAQYIDPAFPKFDLVIFDEASQLPTSEAVGTIARGENVVVVGDPKQLPPTSFFKSNHIDEDNSENEDLESLLDDCLAISMPQESLKWHYRSRHESLIAYSNMKYYNNELYTFPSPRDLVSEVRLVQLDGFYDKGKTRQNRAEAEAIIREIMLRLRDEELRKQSIGVVTFNSNQQKLITDMLLDEFAKNPELEELNHSMSEPVFIKNLENVQGDERDVILFSIGYGPDKKGKVSMNFGPLNREGGWRRLNVAISRARTSMVVYSVLKPEQIDLNSTTSAGVAGLKGFLEFAKSGKNIVTRRIEDKPLKCDSVVKCIADNVRKLGYDVKCNIGCSRFKIDIGVIDPSDDNKYLLGIMLDGENCSKSRTSRDRFVLQPDALERLGWKIIRVWVLDWLDDAEKVMEIIVAEIKKQISFSKSDTRTFDVLKPAPKESFASFNFEKEETPEPTTSARTDYIAASIGVQGNSEMFYISSNLFRIQNAAEKILYLEAPISRKLWYKKVAALWGISRGGSRVESIFESAIASIEKDVRTEGEQKFYWLNGQYRNVCENYRATENDRNKRTMDDIPPQEILCAIQEVLKEQVSLSETDIVRETAKKFGFSRIGNIIECSVKASIDFGIRNNIIRKIDSGKITVCE